MNKSNRYRLSAAEQQMLLTSRINTDPEINNPKNILIIPDIHLPYQHRDALAFSKQVYIDYNCTEVIFLGDVIDNSQTTRWDINPNADSAGLELQKSIDALRPWYQAFPRAVVISGNHELRIQKRFRSAGITEQWLRPISEVLETPNWVFKYEYVQDNIKYLHGEGCGSTLQSVLNSNTSIIFAHYHSKLELIHVQGKFAMCCGWLGDQDSIAMEYARTTLKKGQLGCGVVIDGLPILVPFKLK